jgi:phosphoribosylglycinamide formyltransferase-1
VSGRIVVLISGRGSNLASILRHQREGGLDGEVVAVFSNRPQAPGLEHARREGLPIEVLSHRKFATRADFDAELARRIDAFRPDLVVLAGFMRILGPAFVRHFAGRLINTHPSLLPRFKGLDAVSQALEAGVVETGCSVHFVTEEVDGGPVIAQRRVPIRPGDTREALEARILEQEHQLLPETIARFCRGEIRWADHQRPG